MTGTERREGLMPHGSGVEVVAEIRRASVELERLDVLVASAIGALQASFQTVALGAGVLPGGSPGTDREIQQMELATALDSGIRALQFEDMATQLIRRVRQRIEAVGQAIESGDMSGLSPQEIHSVADRGTALKFGTNDGAADVELF